MFHYKRPCSTTKLYFFNKLENAEIKLAQLKEQFVYDHIEKPDFLNFDWNNLDDFTDEFSRDSYMDQPQVAYSIT